MNVLITINSGQGANIGPNCFLSSNSGTYSQVVTVTQLLNGITISIPDESTIVYVDSIGVCTTRLTLPIAGLPTTTTTTIPGTTTTTLPGTTTTTLPGTTTTTIPGTTTTTVPGTTTTTLPGTTTTTLPVTTTTTIPGTTTTTLPITTTTTAVYDWTKYLGTTNTYATSELACSNKECVEDYYTAQNVPLTLGLTIYAVTNPGGYFNGGSQWITIRKGECSGDTYYTIQVGSSGMILDMITCGVVTTSTTTLASTTTTTAALTTTTTTETPTEYYYLADVYACIDCTPLSVGTLIVSYRNDLNVGTGDNFYSDTISGNTFKITQTSLTSGGQMTTLVGLGAADCITLGCN